MAKTHRHRGVQRGGRGAVLPDALRGGARAHGGAHAPRGVHAHPPAGGVHGAHPGGRLGRRGGADAVLGPEAGGHRGAACHLPGQHHPPGVRPGRAGNRPSPGCTSPRRWAPRPGRGDSGRLAITGTKYLMTGPGLPGRPRPARHRLPDPGRAERERIDRIIFKELVNGVFPEESRLYFNDGDPAAEGAGLRRRGAGLHRDPAAGRSGRLPAADPRLDAAAGPGGAAECGADEHRFVIDSDTISAALFLPRIETHHTRSPDRY